MANKCTQPNVATTVSLTVFAPAEVTEQIQHSRIGGALSEGSPAVCIVPDDSQGSTRSLPMESNTQGHIRAMRVHFSQITRTKMAVHVP